MTYDEITAKVAENSGLSKRLVDRTYRAYWRSIREYIASLPLKDDLTDDEFNSIRPNINIPSIGKLYVTLDRYKGVKELYRKFKQKKDVAHN